MAWSNPMSLWQRGVLGMNARNVAYIARYNERSRYPLVDDKLKTKMIVRKAGVTVPELMQVIATQHEIEAIDAVLAKYDKFVIKPAQGSGGKGILVIVGKDGDHFVKASGARLTKADVKRDLSNILSGLYSLGGKPDVAFVESLVVADKTFEHISYEGVPDIRIIVFKGYPVMGMLRLATKESDGKANLHQGAVGVGLDLGTGRSIAAVQHNRPIARHPDTDHPLADINVPHWRALLTLAARCYDVTRLGYLGADFVLDVHHGPMLLELNARPGLSIQIANNEGLRPRLRAVEALDELLHFTPDERVEWSIEHFAVKPESQADFWQATEQQLRQQHA
ncbi:MAG: alpha-L-glutamate ligase-like protein [Gammaproteobacteria bacterium]|nr:alpha-L-glutamate ligase-like protein [Gammaproteobacteria bacterium]